MKVYPTLASVSMFRAKKSRLKSRDKNGKVKHIHENTLSTSPTVKLKTMTCQNHRVRIMTEDSMIVKSSLSAADLGILIKRFQGRRYAAMVQKK